MQMSDELWRYKNNWYNQRSRWCSIAAPFPLRNKLFYIRIGMAKWGLHYRILLKHNLSAYSKSGIGRIQKIQPIRRFELSLSEDIDLSDVLHIIRAACNEDITKGLRNSIHTNTIYTQIYYLWPVFFYCWCLVYGESVATSSAVKH